MTRLRKEIVAKATVSKITKNGSHTKLPKLHFRLLDNSNLITLDSYQQTQLLKALKIYYPDLYTDIVVLKHYNIQCEAELDKFLKKLDEEMQSNFDTWSDCYTPEYDFLRKLRSFYLTK